MNILFVCTGNTCRSPMAAALLRKKMPEVHVESAGIFAASGNQANAHAIQALHSYDIDLDHKTHPITDQLLHWSDLVLTMTTQHKQTLIVQFPRYQEKYYTLKEYVSSKDQAVWKELRELYATYETRRSLFIKENELKLNQTELEEKVREHLAEEIKRIQQLEANLINYDIPDPFGGSLDVYEETLKHLDQYITALVKKLRQKKEDDE